MEKSPEEEENQYLSDQQINKLIKKVKLKTWRILPVFLVLGAVAGYFSFWWMFIPMGSWLIWWVLKR
jgi:hypothetical protein